jgi:hypothetical protein
VRSGHYFSYVLSAFGGGQVAGTDGKSGKMAEAESGGMSRWRRLCCGSRPQEMQQDEPQPQPEPPPQPQPQPEPAAAGEKPTAAAVEAGAPGKWTLMNDSHVIHHGNTAASGGSPQQVTHLRHSRPPLHSTGGQEPTTSLRGAGDLPCVQL